MRSFALNHVADMPLLDELDRAIGCEHVSTAWVVAHIAEVDLRELYRLRGYDSMHAYGVGWCRLSEDAAYRRIQAARAARKHPCLFDELATGRLNLSAVCLIAPHLTAESVGEVVDAARHRSNAEIKQWLTEKLFARSEAPPPAPAARQLPVGLPPPAAGPVRVGTPLLGPEVRGPSEPVAPVALAMPVEREVRAKTPELTPGSGPLEFEMRFTISREDQERFRYAQALLGHAIPSGDVAAIYRRAIEAIITECEKRKLSATGKPPGEGSPVAGRPRRHIPAHVRRAVWVRDEGRCTDAAPSGQRCDARRLLEFDHIVPVARGGRSTVENVRLRCRAHNQDAARRVLGARFMNGRRRRAAIARAVGRVLPAWNDPGMGPRGP